MKVIKQISAITLAMVITVSSVTITPVTTKADNDVNATCSIDCQKEINDSIDDSEDSDEFEVQNGKIVYDEEEIYTVLNDIDMAAINKEYENMGMAPMTNEELADVFISGIENTNEQLDSGELTMLEDGSMIESDDDSFYLQGGSTYDKTYWWGKWRYKSTKDANNWVKKLNRTAAAEGGIGVVANAILGPVPGVVGGVCCWICWDLAASVDYYNGLSNRGIKARIPWCIVGYKVRKQ